MISILTQIEVCGLGLGLFSILLKMINEIVANQE